MDKFKVGDLVKVISADDEERKKYVGVIGKIIEDMGPGYRWSLTTTGKWLFRDDELELVEWPLKTTELKINGNEIKIAAKPFKITTDDLLAPNTVNLEEQYKRYVLGIWDKENPMVKKEGNEMIESMNLIDLYASKHKESIEKETKEKVEELRKNCDVINKFNELVEQFEKDCDELYLSQFTEEEKNEILTNQDVIDDRSMQLRTHCDNYDYKYYTNDRFHNDEYFEIMNEKEKKLSEIDDLVKTVKAHVGIAKTKEEVEEILTRYGIIDKKGKLVIK